MRYGRTPSAGTERRDLLSSHRNIRSKDGMRMGESEEKQTPCMFWACNCIGPGRALANGWERRNWPFHRGDLRIVASENRAAQCAQARAHQGLKGVDFSDWKGFIWPWCSRGIRPGADPLAPSIPQQFRQSPGLELLGARGGGRSIRAGPCVASALCDVLLWGRRAESAADLH